jgi:hypothetical protein
VDQLRHLTVMPADQDRLAPKLFFRKSFTSFLISLSAYIVLTSTPSLSAVGRIVW